MAAPERTAETGGENARPETAQTRPGREAATASQTGKRRFMGLIGIVIASVVNIFTKSAMMDFVISCVGVLVFLGLTAYDTQKLKVMALPPFDGVTGHFDFVDDGNPVKSLFITRVTDGSTHLQTIKMPPPEPCHP